MSICVVAVLENFSVLIDSLKEMEYFVICNLVFDQYTVSV